MRASTLGAILDLLARHTGEKFDAATFESRLRIQKTIYLLQALGTPEVSSYSFSRYFHGPYCPDLAKDYYALNEGRAHARTDAVTLPQAALNIVSAVRKGNAFLEAASTLHMVRKTGATKDQAFEIVKGMKPHLGDHTLTEAWEYLVANHLVSNT